MLLCTTLLSFAMLADAQPGVSVTIYSSADPAGFDPQQFIAQQRMGSNPMFAWQVPGFGVVKEQRSVALQQGVQSLRFVDVAAYIDPTTVSFTDLLDPSTSVLEQNFEFDLVSPEKLLDRFIDQEIELSRAVGDTVETTKGTLLSSAGDQFIVRTADGLRMVPRAGTRVALPALPEGLITKPTLVWKLHAKSPGERLVRTTYQTGGLTWKADYNLVLDESETSADMSAWVTLLNVSGGGYRDATLKLVAGDVQRIRPQAPMSRGRRSDGMLAMEADLGAGFEEKSFFEYHLYTLPRRTDILANTTQQITLFPTATGVPVAKELVYSPTGQFAAWGFGSEPYADRNLGGSSEKSVDVFIRFVNDEPSGLGRPMPRGKIRLYKEDDADGTLEFIGEDLIDHTPRNERVRVRVGRAFDVVGERTQTDFTIDNGRRTMTETIRIELRNRKDAPQKVVVRELLYRWTNWEIVRGGDGHRKIDSRTIEFDVEVPADGTKVLEYTVRYTW